MRCSRVSSVSREANAGKILPVTQGSAPSASERRPGTSGVQRKASGSSSAQAWASFNEDGEKLAASKCIPGSSPVSRRAVKSAASGLQT